jgi:signal transduction histidine kinase
MLTIYAGYLYLRLRERNLLSERQTLKLKVEERTTELQMRNEEVQAQAEELQSQAIEIKKINDHLEELVKERTLQLEKKNLALEEYAFITAHKLRSPLARILGLVNLMKITPHTPESKECMGHLEVASKELDQVVSSISRVIEKADL